MHKWSVEVDHGGFNQECHTTTTPKILAMELSRQYPHALVSICANARIRMIIVAGEIRSNWDDLSQFYLEESEVALYNWKHIL